MRWTLGLSAPTEEDSLDNNYSSEGVAPTVEATVEA